MAAPILILTNRQILGLHEGLKALDGIVEKSGQNTEVTRFNFDDKVAWNLAKNSDIVERAVSVYERARKSLGARLGVVNGMKLTETNAAAVATYQDEEELLLEKTQDLSGILNVTLRELQTGNKIPPSVLKNLIPIINA